MKKSIRLITLTISIILLFIVFFVSFSNTKEVKIIGTKQIHKSYADQQVSEIYKLEITNENPEVEVGKYLGLTKRVYPGSAIDEPLKWSSSDETIATVNENGTVKGIKAGNATITVKTLDGSVSASKTIKVIAKGEEKITNLKILDKNPSVKMGEYVGIEIEVTPGSLINTPLTWTSSNKSIATVSEKGVVKGIKEGTATITVKSPDGNVSASTVVTVIYKDISKITKIELTDENPEVIVGKYIGLGRTITPKAAVGSPLVWTSSDESIATVDQNGLVKGIKAGAVTITAKSEDGSVSDSKVVKVLDSTTPHSEDYTNKEDEDKVDSTNTETEKEKEKANESTSNGSVLTNSNGSQDIKTYSTGDSSSSTKTLPKAGNCQNIFLVLIAIATLFAIISYKKFKKLN